MKKRLFLLALCASMLSACGAEVNPPSDAGNDHEQGQTDDPVIPTKTLSSIDIITQPSKVKYKEGESFDPTGMVVQAVYSDESKEVITNYEVPNQALTPFVTIITISYQGKTADINITVIPVARYTITFMSSETEKIQDVICKEGDVPSCEYSIPSTEQYDFVLLGWSLTPKGQILPELPEATENATYYAIVSQNTRKYTVIFNDFNGNLVSSSEVEYGSTPIAPNYEPEDTAQYDYTFVGWALTQGGTPVVKLEPISGPVTYYAVVESTVRSYTVKFFNENGIEIQSGTLQYGATPSCDYEVEDTAEWDYTTKWATSAGGTALGSLPNVTGNANYYAVATKVKQKYDISFKNEDGTDYKKINVEYGVVPTVVAPTKQADKQFTYTFAGWSTTKGGEALSSLPAVTGEATYFAIFSKVTNKYTIILNMNCEEDSASITADYGTSFEDFDEYIPEREGYKFAGWCSDEECENKITLPFTLTDDTELYAKWNEKIDIKKYFNELMNLIVEDPYSYIPETLKSDYEANLIEESDVLNYETAQNVSDIKTVGFGEQWQMVIDNMNQSETFYKAITGSSVFFTVVTAFRQFFENNPEDTYEEIVDDTMNRSFAAACKYENKVFTLKITYSSYVDVPLLGKVAPVVEMNYDIETGLKTLFVKLNDNNKLKFASNENSFIFGLEYGVTIGEKTGIRTAYCQLDKIVDEKNEEDVSYQGHIYEYFSYLNDESQKTLLKSSADFYIDDEYCSVIGNKASGLIGATSMINELYDVEHGQLLGYMVEEDITKWGFTCTYHTFWFNLIDISGITSVKAVPNGKVDSTDNHHDIYLNGSSKIFEPAYNKKIIKTSRKYDVEMRNHYFYGIEDAEFVKCSAQIPMMFIQDDDKWYDNGYSNTNFSDFTSDIEEVSKISNAYVKVNNCYIEKIRNDCINLGAIYKENKESVTADAIIEWLK